jgi:hypothetical protein
MAGPTEEYAFQVTCPVATLITAPQVINLAMPVRTVLGVRVRVPPGPNGKMGFAIGAAGASIIPIVAGTWIVAADEIFDWSPPFSIDSGAWQARMYNQGGFPHTIYILFSCKFPDSPDVASTVQPVSVAAAAPTDVSLTVPVTSALPAAPELT